MRTIVDALLDRMERVDSKPVELPFIRFANFCAELLLEDRFKNESNETILSYLLEFRRSGERHLKKCKLFLVGAAEAGKTTLVRRLAWDRFDGKNERTVGIEIHDVQIGDAHFKVFDFAGQLEYVHTHRLFFGSEASVYLAVIDPRSSIWSAFWRRLYSAASILFKLPPVTVALDQLKEFLRMKGTCARAAPVVVATTFARRRQVLEGRIIEELRPLCGESCDRPCAVDSSDGSGVKELKERLGASSAVRSHRLPRTYSMLLEALRTSAARGAFSISPEEFARISVDAGLVGDRSVTFAKDLLAWIWGEVYILSNEDVVLQPQRLADVLARVFKVEGISRTVVDGIFEHKEDLLRTVWQSDQWSDSLWSFNGNLDTFPPFLDLLHKSGLAFPLYNEDGQSLRQSLIPSQLPEAPPRGIRSTLPTAVFLERVAEKVFPSTTRMVNNGHVVITIDAPGMPLNLFAQLQVKLRHMTVRGGSWRNGCCLSADGPSHAIVMKTSEDALLFASFGRNTSARTIALDKLIKLRNELFPEMRWSESGVSFFLNDKTYRDDALWELLGRQDVEEEEVRKSCGLTFLKPSSSVMPVSEDPVEIIRILLNMRSPGTEVRDWVEVDSRLQLCVPWIMRVLFAMPEGTASPVRALWLIFEIDANLAAKRRRAYLFSPARFEGQPWRNEGGLYVDLEEEDVLPFRKVSSDKVLSVLKELDYADFIVQANEALNGWKLSEMSVDLGGSSPMARRCRQQMHEIEVTHFRTEDGEAISRLSHRYKGRLVHRDVAQAIKGTLTSFPFSHSEVGSLLLPCCQLCR